MNATVTMQLRVKTPALPNFVEIDGPRPRSLDDAFNRGLVMDVGELDAAAIEAVIKQWAEAFRQHAAARAKDRA